MTTEGNRRLAWCALVGALSLVAGGCELISPMSRSGDIKIVMNPDSTQFAYLLEYRRYPGWPISIPPAAARAEIWTYDLTQRRGPRRVGRWSHDWGTETRLLLWTAEGLWLDYRQDGETEYELMDVKRGRRRSAYPPPQEDLHPATAPTDVYRHRRHVEVHHGEFSLWDPETLKLIPLFALPVDSSAGDSQGRYELQSRDDQRRQDGIQRIDRVEAARGPNAMHLRIRTYARRAAPFARRYRLQFEITSPEHGESPNEAIVGPVAMWDTMVTPDPPGDVLAVNLPYSRFWKALRPGRDLMRGYGSRSRYMGNLVTTLVPDSLEGDERVPPGIRDGSVSWNWTMIEIPLP